MIQKTLSLLICVLAFMSITVAQTQLPNLGFEKWSKGESMEYTFDVPTGWGVGEICANMGAETECSIGAVKTTEAYEGDYAVKITEGGMLGLNILDMKIDQKPEAIALYINMENFDAESTSISLFGILHKNSFLDDEPVYVQEAIKEYTTKEYASGYHKVIIPFVDSEEGDPTAEFNYLTVLFLINDADEGDVSSVLIDNIVLVYDNKSEVSDIEDPNNATPEENPVDEEIRLIATELHIYEYEDGFYPEERFEFTYNGKGQIESATWLDPMYFGKWEEYYTYTYEYNAEGKVVSEESLGENEVDANGFAADPDNFYRSFWLTTIYNGNGDESKTVSIVEKADRDNGYIYKDTITTTHEYTYDADGNITSHNRVMIENRYGMSADTSTATSTNIYDNNGLLLSNKWTSYEGKEYLSEYTYNANNQIEVGTFCTLINGVCDGTPGTETYTYDENGNVIERVSIGNDVDTKEIYEYDLTQDNIFSEYDREFLYDVVDFDFVPETEITFNNLVTKTSHYERWDENDEWTKYAYLNFEYSGLASDSEDKEEDQNKKEDDTQTTKQITNNPVSVEYRAGTLVSSDASSKVAYELFSANGTLITKGTFKGTRQVSELSAGMYIAKVSTKNSSGTITFIVQ